MFIQLLNRIIMNKGLTLKRETTINYGKLQPIIRLLSKNPLYNFVRHQTLKYKTLESDCITILIVTSQ